MKKSSQKLCNTGILSKIQPDEISTWIGKVFITLDVDWAHDEIIADTHNLLNNTGIETTWFITHSSNFLQTLINDSQIELGIHPNFNKLLNAEGKNSSINIIQDILSIIPNAKAVRSHSLVQSELLIDQFRSSGLTHISNTFIPFGCGILIRPYLLWNDTIIIPHCWQDNVALKMKSKFPKIQDADLGLIVYNFHPIHIFLNTENLDRYESTRSLHQKPDELIKYRYDGYGTRNMFIELINSLKE